MNGNRGSLTAERVAQRRAAHQLLDAPRVFDDPLALRVLDAQVAARLRAHPEEHDRTALAPYLRAAFAVRSRFAEDELAAAVAGGIGQYVVLGAGLDTFAYRNPYPELRVLEVDHPDTQATKRRRLQEGGIEVPASMTFVPVDFARTRLRDALAAAGFDADAPAFFSWLGVVPYLELGAIREVLAFVSALPAGTAIVFDYGVPRSSLSGPSRRVYDEMARRVAAAGEPWKSYFETPDLIDLLRTLGFSSAADFDAAALNARYFDGRADGLRIGQAVHIMRAGM